LDEVTLQNDETEHTMHEIHKRPYFILTIFFCFYLLCDKRCESISKFYVMDNMDEGKSFVLHSIYKRQPLKQ